MPHRAICRPNVQTKSSPTASRSLWTSYGTYRRNQAHQGERIPTQVCRFPRRRNGSIADRNKGSADAARISRPWPTRLASRAVAARAVADRLGGPSAWHRRGINGLFRSAGCGEAKLAGRTVRCHEFGRRSVMAGKARTRPSWKRNTARYQEQVAPAKTREGQENLQKKNRYANRGG
jgi:hypothetical protein